LFSPLTAVRALLAVCLLPAIASAHELWIQPDPPSLASSPQSQSLTREVAIRMFTGERFQGEELGWDPERCAEMRDDFGGTSRELRGERGAAPAAYIRMAMDEVHLVSYRSHPATAEIDPRTFNTYLLEHGLREPWETRQDQGDLDRPGRERFSRYCKTIVAPSGARTSLPTAGVVLGHRLEIVPTSCAGQGSGIPFQILFEGKPLPNAVVFAAPQANPQKGLAREVSDAHGLVTFTVDQPGLWMISLVHMIPCAGCTDADWESFWASFVLSSPLAIGSLP